MTEHSRDTPPLTVTLESNGEVVFSPHLDVDLARATSAGHITYSGPEPLVPGQAVAVSDISEESDVLLAGVLSVQPESGRAELHIHWEHVLKRDSTAPGGGDEPDTVRAALDERYLEQSYSNADFRQLLRAIQHFCDRELDQWVRWRMPSAFGEVYISIGRRPTHGSDATHHDPVSPEMPLPED